MSGNLSGEIDDYIIKGDIDLKGYQVINSNLTSVNNIQENVVVNKAQVQEMLEDYRETGLPVGSLFHSYKDLSNQDRFLLCDGSSYDIIKYNKLFQILNSQYGNLLPDLRGLTLKYPDQTQSNNTIQQEQVGSHQHQYLDTSVGAGYYGSSHGIWGGFTYVGNIYNIDSSKQTINDTNPLENRINSYLCKIYIVALNDSEQQIPIDSIVFNQIRNQAQTNALTTLDNYIELKLDSTSAQFNNENDKLNLKLFTPINFKNDSHNIELDQNSLKYNSNNQLTFQQDKRPTLQSNTYANISNDEIISKSDLEQRLITFNPSSSQDAIKFNSLDSNKLQVYNNQIVLTLNNSNQMIIIPNQCTFNGRISLNQYYKATDNFQLVQYQQLQEAINDIGVSSGAIQSYIQSSDYSTFQAGFLLNQYFQIKDSNSKFLEIARSNNYMYLRTNNLLISDMNDNQKITSGFGVTRLKNNVVRVCNDANFTSCQFSQNKYLTDSSFNHNYIRMPLLLGGEINGNHEQRALTIRQVHGMNQDISSFLPNSIMRCEGLGHFDKLSTDYLYLPQASSHTIRGKLSFLNYDGTSGISSSIIINNAQYNYSIHATQVAKFESGFEYTVISDKNIKNSIQPFQSNKLDMLTPYNYNYNNDQRVPEYLRSTNQNGFILQDLQELDLHKYIKNNEINYPLLIQDLVLNHQQKINKMEKRMKILESKLNQLLNLFAK